MDGDIHIGRLTTRISRHPRHNQLSHMALEAASLQLGGLIVQELTSAWGVLQQEIDELQLQGHTAKKESGRCRHAAHSVSVEVRKSWRASRHIEDQ
jgi:uncharacterized small protein (DUF1192 family)